MSINDESLWKAVHRMEAAAQDMRQQADRMEQAATAIKYQFEPGYGGNGLRLVELLDRLGKES